MPNQALLHFDIEGTKQRNHNGGDNAAGKPNVIERITFMCVMDMRGKRRNDKADGNAHGDGKQQANGDRKHGQLRDLRDLCNNGRKAGAVKADVDVAGKRGAVVFGIKPNARQQRPDIENIFPKQGKAKHKA